MVKRRDLEPPAVVEDIFWLFPGFNRSQILFYIGENLELRKSELADRISALTGKSVDEASAEVEASIRRLFYWAAFADKVRFCSAL